MHRDTPSEGCGQNRSDLGAVFIPPVCYERHLIC
jgi:hypothetical protein